MPNVPFSKYEGLGNDFVVIEDGGAGWSPERARTLCDRHFGIGADGILLVSRSELPGAAGKMVVLNADGSRPEMCGNGLRCVALHLAKTGQRESGALLVETDAGVLACVVDPARQVVDIEMGTLQFLGEVEVPVEDGARSFHRWSIGNPHAITFTPATRQEMERVGPRVERHPLFPQGTNVEFARIADDGAIDLVVWERGVGFTLACGTGACATVASACARGLAAYGLPVTVRLPGGSLEVTVAESTLQARMSGPARRVFSGEVQVS